jgi:hypothetical protein
MAYVFCIYDKRRIQDPPPVVLRTRKELKLP